jgi:hypothetical protein
MGKNLTFWEKVLLHGWTKLPNWQNLERGLFRNSLASSNFLDEQMAFSCLRQGLHNEGTSPDPDGVNYARPLKVTKAERF